MQKGIIIRTSQLALTAALVLPLSGCLFRSHKVENRISTAKLLTATRDELVANALAIHSRRDSGLDRTRGDRLGWRMLRRRAFERPDLQPRDEDLPCIATLAARTRPGSGRRLDRPRAAALRPRFDSRRKAVPGVVREGGRLRPGDEPLAAHRGDALPRRNCRVGRT